MMQAIAAASVQDSQGPNQLVGSPAFLRCPSCLAEKTFHWQRSIYKLCCARGVFPMEIEINYISTEKTI